MTFIVKGHGQTYFASDTGRIAVVDAMVINQSLDIKPVQTSQSRHTHVRSLVSEGNAVIQPL